MRVSVIGPASGIGPAEESSNASDMMEVVRSYLHRKNLESSWTKAACGFVYMSYGNLFWCEQNARPGGGVSRLVSFLFARTLLYSFDL